MKACGLSKAQVGVAKPDLHHQPSYRLDGPALLSCMRSSQRKRPASDGTERTQCPQREEQARETYGSDTNEEDKLLDHDTE